MRKGCETGMEKIEQAVHLMNQGEIDEALTILKQLLPTVTDDEKFYISELYYEWGFFEEAIVLIEELLETYPKEGQLITKLSEMYIELEKDEQAIDLLNEIDKGDAFYLPSLLQLADLYQAQGLFEVSEQKLLEAKQLAPDEKVIDFALGELLFSVGQYSRSIPFYERVALELTEINHIQVHERLAESHAIIGHYEKALAYYSQLNPENPDTLFKYGFTAFQHDRNDIAITVWKQLLEKDPYYHTVYPELALAMKEEGLLDEALSIVKQGLMYDEFNKELFYFAAELATSLQQTNKAIDYLNKAISLDPDYHEAIMLLIQLYNENKQFIDIIELITSINETGIKDPIYEWELAKAYNEDRKSVV